MNKEFVTYEQALALKELGFDEPCFGYFDNTQIKGWLFDTTLKANTLLFTPLKQQVFRWAFSKLGITDANIPLDDVKQEKLIDELIVKLSSKHLLV